MRAVVTIEYKASSEFVIEYDSPEDGANKIENAVKLAMPDGYRFDMLDLRTRRIADAPTTFPASGGRH